MTGKHANQCVVAHDAMVPPVRVTANKWGDLPARSLHSSHLCCWKWSDGHGSTIPTARSLCRAWPSRRSGRRWPLPRRASPRSH